jgi:hypothetical protein
MLRFNVQIDEDTISSVLCSAIESGAGSGYWLKAVKVINFDSNLVTFETSFKEYPTYLVALIDREDSGLQIITHDKEKTAFINRQCIMDTLEIMAKQYAVNFGNILSKDSDAEDADVFLQVACFGKVLYS